MGRDGKQTLNKMRIAAHLNEKLGLTKRESKEIVDCIFTAMSRELAVNNEVKISNFGTFGIRHKSVRPGRNPRTMAPVTVSARTVVSLHASQALKALVD